MNSKLLRHPSLFACGLGDPTGDEQMMRFSMIFAALVIASPAGAATLKSVDGDVLVNAGNGFVRATAGQEVRSGDRVMVGARGGAAAIAYDQGCLENVQKGHVVTVKPFSPCGAADSGDGESRGRGAGAVGGSGGGVVGPVAGGIPNAALIAGGAAVAVGVGVGIYQLSKPSSP